MGDMADDVINKMMESDYPYAAPKNVGRRWAGLGEINGAIRPKSRYDDFFNGNSSTFVQVDEPIRKQTKMTTRKTLESIIDQAGERLARLDRFPREDNYPTGTIIGFDVRFSGEGSKVYHYAGVKTEKGWFITGRDAYRGFSWDELVSHWAEDLGGEVTALVVCSEVEELIEPIETEVSAYGDDVGDGQ